MQKQPALQAPGLELGSGLSTVGSICGPQDEYSSLVPHWLDADNVNVSAATAVINKNRFNNKIFITFNFNK
ncbi:hypothetical protein GCM10022218_17060 [Sphingobacterium ginsenosidimutans]|uniref:Outer membrane protein beta-barrel domain-containing protein n=1 Tax=Sphingobacterium ginsenosidimutans TaxID=687845 RepID=A0ABP7ZYP6_9SPHI